LAIDTLIFIWTNQRPSLGPLHMHCLSCWLIIHSA
jgi:hypothetical protein